MASPRKMAIQQPKLSAQTRDRHSIKPNWDIEIGAVCAADKSHESSYCKFARLIASNPGNGVSYL
jgi:hypothetical protein